MIALVPFLIHPVHAFALPAVGMPSFMVHGLWFAWAVFSWWLLRDWRFVIYCLVFATGVAWASYAYLCIACLYVIVITLMEEFRNNEEVSDDRK